MKQRELINVEKTIIRLDIPKSLNVRLKKEANKIDVSKKYLIQSILETYFQLEFPKILRIEN